jgi:hypothetical protein
MYSYGRHALCSCFDTLAEADIGVALFAVFQPLIQMWTGTADGCIVKKKSNCSRPAGAEAPLDA